LTLVLSIAFWYVRREMRIALAFGICLIVFAVFGDDHGLRAMLQARRDARVLASEIGALRAENAVLRQRAEALRSDPRAIEDAARGTLGLVRPGEIVATVRRP
jgi:cell division protein FtsB